MLSSQAVFLRSLLLVLAFVFAAEAAPRVELVRRGLFSNSHLIEGRDGALYGWQWPSKIYRMTRTGQMRIICDFGEETWIYSFRQGGDGHFYCLPERGGLYRISTSGAWEEIWNSAGMPSSPDSLITELDENLYALRDDTFFRLTSNGTFEIAASLGGFQIDSIAAGADGALWVAGKDAQAQWAMRRVLRDGTVEDPITSGALPGAVHRLFRAPDGSLTGIADAGAGKVFLRITPAGEIQQLGPYPIAELPASSVVGDDGSLLFFAWSDDALLYELLAVGIDGSVKKIASVPRSMPVDLVNGRIISGYDGTIFATGDPRWNGQKYPPGGFLRVRGARALATNAPPLARGDFRRPPKPGETVSIKVLANDFDLDGDQITLTEVGQPLHGSVTADLARGIVHYTAPPGEPVLVDEIRYVISDGQGGTASGQVVLRPNIRGTFHSLFESEEPAADGRLSVTLANFGALTGKLWIGGRRESFTGRLDAENRFSLQRTRGGDPDSSVTLRLELRADASGHPVIHAEIEALQKSFEAELVRPFLAAAAQAAGAYTFALPSDPAWAAEPEFIGGFNVPLRRNPIYGVQGAGIGHIRVQTSGVATLAGTLPDGVPFTAAAIIAPSGRLETFGVFKGRHTSRDDARLGWLTGHINFADEASEIAGALRWVQPWATTAVTHTDSYFERNLDGVGSRYSPVPHLQAESGTALELSAAEGGMPSPISASAQVNGNALAGVLPLRLNGNFVPATGFVSGHVSFPGSGAWTSYRGVLLQKQGRILGQFKSLTGRGTGRLAIERK